MRAAGGGWATHQLTEFLSAVSAYRDEGSALAGAAEWAAEALDAEIGAVVVGGAIIASVGCRGRTPDPNVVDLLVSDAMIGEIRGLGRIRLLRVTLDDGETMLVLARAGDDVFSGDEIILLRAMARTLSLTLGHLRALSSERKLRTRSDEHALENLRLLTMVREREALLERLSRIRLSISRRAPLSEVLTAIVTGAAELLGDDVAGLRLVDPCDPTMVRLVASAGLDPSTVDLIKRSPLGLGTGGRAVTEDRLIIFEDYPESEAAVPAIVERGVKASMAAPIHENGRAVGSVVVASMVPGRTFSPAEQEALLAFANYASLALNDAKSVETMQRLAYQDPLTSLANRAMLLDSLKRSVARAQRHGGELAVLFLDLDDFKDINDSHGHATGDAVLAEVASRLNGCVRSEDTVGRIGGDEFAVVLEGPEVREDALAIAQRLLSALSQPISAGGRIWQVGASVGVALSADGTLDGQELLRNADLAMYRAKALGGNGLVVFEQGMHAALEDRLTLVSEMREALAADRFALHYQPIVHLATGSLHGVEALMRWERPGHGFMAPATFIPLAEECGLIVPIGRWVLNEALRQAREWKGRSSSGRIPQVSVNLSARQLHHPDLVAGVAAALSMAGIPASLLTLEITETALMLDRDGAGRTLRELRQLGVRLALDDFGTGYSSLSFLRHFPIDVLKIDKSFVDGLTVGSEDSAVARAIIELGRSLGMQTVAEGIETEEQRQHLLALGCELGQGYHFHRPLPAPAVEQLFEAQACQLRPYP
jgi:diguanylate cyclase (GGDEF)-like protein